MRRCNKWSDFEDKPGIGHHCLEAVKSLGWERIDSVFVELDDVDRQLWEIDEILCRAELTEVQQVQHIKRRADLWKWRQASGNTFPTSNGGTDSEGVGRKGFAQETSEATGMSRRLINLKLEHATKIALDVLDDIQGTDMDKG